MIVGMPTSCGEMLEPSFLALEGTSFLVKPNTQIVGFWKSKQTNQQANKSTYFSCWSLWIGSFSYQTSSKFLLKNLSCQVLKLFCQKYAQHLLSRKQNLNLKPLLQNSFPYGYCGEIYHKMPGKDESQGRLPEPQGDLSIRLTVLNLQCTF